MSFNPEDGTEETLHDRPTNASVDWRTEARKVVRRREDEDFILIESIECEVDLVWFVVSYSRVLLFFL